MANGSLLFIAGAIVGATLSGFAVWSNWQQDASERSSSYRDISDQYSKADGERRVLELRLKSITDNSYDRAEIIKCMSFSTDRNYAIDTHLNGNLMGSIEKSVFAPLLPVALKNINASVQMRRSALALESARLDNECLDGAMLHHFGSAHQ